VCIFLGFGDRSTAAGVAGDRGRREPAPQLQLRADEPDVPRVQGRGGGRRRRRRRQEVRGQGNPPLQVRRRLRLGLRAQGAPRARPLQGDRGLRRRRHAQGMRNLRRRDRQQVRKKSDWPSLAKSLKMD